jgi:hypothetical protein
LGVDAGSALVFVAVVTAGGHARAHEFFQLGIRPIVNFLKHLMAIDLARPEARQELARLPRPARQ